MEDLFTNRKKLTCKSEPKVGLKCTMIWQYLAFGCDHSFTGVVTKIFHTMEKDGYDEIEVRPLETIKNPKTGKIKVTDKIADGYPRILRTYDKNSKNREWRSENYYYCGKTKVRKLGLNEFTLDLDVCELTR